MRVEFWCECKPEPQGSARAFVRGNRAVITSDNPKLHKYRSIVATHAGMAIAREETARPAFGKHMPVRMYAEFVLEPPAKLPKGRTLPVVRPDLDKLLRGLNDSLTGVMYADDSQVVQITASKRYGSPAGVRVVCEEG